MGGLRRATRASIPCNASLVDDVDDNPLTNVVGVVAADERVSGAGSESPSSPSQSLASGFSSRGTASSREADGVEMTGEPCGMVAVVWSGERTMERGEHPNLTAIPSMVSSSSTGISISATTTPTTQLATRNNPECELRVEGW